jgi:hypothetical protein
MGVPAAWNSNCSVRDGLLCIKDKEMNDEKVNENPTDEEATRLMAEHDIDEDTAEKVQELVDEGLDEEDAVEIAQEL